MSNADIFLELYRNLEELLEVKYYDGRKHVGSTVMRFYNEEEGKKWREELNVCREMRNMLSHHSDIGGQPVFEPSDEVIRVMREIIDDVKNPPVAMKYATPADQIVSCKYSDRLEFVVRMMMKHGYSHVPVIENGKLVGVFSVGTLFSMMEKYGMEHFRNNMRIRDLKEFLPVNKHFTEAFGFVSDTAPFGSIKYKFTAKGPKENRIVMLFVTANGRSDERVLGIITPWDIIKGTGE